MTDEEYIDIAIEISRKAKYANSEIEIVKEFHCDKAVEVLKEA